jgi:hypothetical protein
MKRRVKISKQGRQVEREKPKSAFFRKFTLALLITLLESSKVLSRQAKPVKEERECKRTEIF